MSIRSILARRSIRQYTSQPVQEEQLEKLLEAGMAAPSARNRKPWHFVVVTGRDRLNQLSEAHPYGDMLKQAPAAIAVCGDTAISPDYWVQDCSAATENILIAAASIGLGSVWLGCHPRRERVEAIKEVLEIPENTEVLSLIAIGHPGEEKEPRTQYDSSRVHRDKW